MLDGYDTPVSWHNIATTDCRGGASADAGKVILDSTGEAGEWVVQFSAPRIGECGGWVLGAILEEEHPDSEQDLD